MTDDGSICNWLSKKERSMEREESEREKESIGDRRRNERRGRECALRK